MCVVHLVHEQARALVEILILRCVGGEQNDDFCKERSGKKEESQAFEGCALSSIPCLAFLYMMPKDTLDNNKILAILRMANEDMLHASGNPVYLRLKADLECLK